MLLNIYPYFFFARKPQERSPADRLLRDIKFDAIEQLTSQVRQQQQQQPQQQQFSPLKKQSRELAVRNREMLFRLYNYTGGFLVRKRSLCFILRAFHFFLNRLKNI